VRLWSVAFQHRKGGPPFYGYAVLVASTLVVLATYSCTIDVLCLLFAPITIETGLSRSSLSAFMLVGTWSAGALQPFTGRLVDRFGARVVGCLAMLVHACGLFSLSLARGAPGLVIGYTLVRVGGIAGTLLSQDALLSKWFVRRLGGVVAAQRMVMGILGVSLIPVTVGQLVPRVGWRGTYAILALPLLLVCPFAAVVLVPTPEAVGMLPDGDGDKPRDSAPLLDVDSSPAEEDATAVSRAIVLVEEADMPDPWAALLAPPPLAPSQSQKEGERIQWSTHDALRTRTFWALIGLCFSTCCTTGGVTAHNSLIAADAGVPLARMTQLVLIPSSVMYLIVNFSWGLMLDRKLFPMRGLFTAAFTFMTAATGCAIGMLAAGRSGRTGLRDGLAALYGLLYGSGIGSIYYLYKVVWAHFFGRKNVGAIMGVANFTMFAAIGMGPVMYGLTRDNAGSYAPILRVSCVMCGANAAVAYFVVQPPVKWAIGSRTNG